MCAAVHEVNMTSGASLPCTQDDLLGQLEREIASVKQELQETR